MKRLPPILIAPLFSALLALAFGLILLGYGAHTAAGVRVFPLDDSYIHLQYAWQAAHGQFLVYAPGDTPSTGATSLLYMLLLAGGFTLGIGREAMPGAILAVNLALYAASAALIADMGRRAAERVRWENRSFGPTGVGLIAGVLFAASGWMAWAFASGMEAGLLIALVIGALWASLARRARLMAVFVALAALTRPEGFILALMLALSEAILRDPAETNDHARRILWAVGAVIVGLIPFAVNLFATGTVSAAGLQAKSWLNLSPFYADEVAGRIAAGVAQAVLLVFGGPAPDGHWHAIPLMQVFAWAGIVLAAVRGRDPLRRLMWVAGGWALIGLAATATLKTALWHHARYQMPFYPALLIPFVLALTRVAGDVAARLRRSGTVVAWAAMGAVLLIWAALSLADFGPLYALDTHTVRDQQMALADWLRAHTPDDARVAVHDVGVMAFAGQRATFDVVGLTTPGMAQVSRDGPGSIYEALENAQPDYYAVYPDAAPPYFGLDAAPALLGEELFRVTLDPFSPFASAGGTQAITRPDWSGAARADDPQQPSALAQIAGWTRADMLDVADLDAEEAHDYAWWNGPRLPGFPSEPRRMAYREAPAVEVTDGGRLLSGGESFTLHTRPGAWAALVARLHQTDDMTLRVTVNGLDAGLWRLPAIPGEWLESVFLVPPELIRGGETRFTLQVEEAPSGARYSPFHYWLYQGQAAALPPAPAAISGAAFGNVAALRGFDLPGRMFAPGDSIPLTLYWEALAPPRADHRVFVHLVDPANDTAEGILGQDDSPPRRGTYPFWVWRAHESVSETITLTVPPDARPGPYVLLVGIYDAATGERLPIVGGEDFGASRLVLARVTVR